MILQRKVDTLKFMLENAVGTERVRTMPPLVLMEALNAAQDDIIGRLALLDESYGVRTLEFTAQSTNPTLLPEYATTLLDLRYAGSGGIPGNRFNIGDHRYRQAQGNDVYLVGKTLEFSSPPSSTLRMDFRGSCWPMFLTKIATSSGKTIFTLDAGTILGEVYAEPDYYVGGIVRVTDLTSKLYQRSRVATFVATSLTVTISPELWITPPEGGPVWHVELESEVPASLHGNLIDIAFARLTGNLDAKEKILRGIIPVSIRKAQFPGKPHEVGY